MRPGNPLLPLRIKGRLGTGAKAIRGNKEAASGIWYSKDYGTMTWTISPIILWGEHHGGCRDFTIEKAREHWGSPDYVGGSEQAAECLARVELIATLAKARGWAEAALAEAEQDT